MLVNDPVLVKARELTFHFDEDLAALQQMRQRLASTARAEQVISYSDLVKGILFHLPTVRSHGTLELGVPEWSDLHRTIIGNCLGRLSCESYEQGKFLISSVAVSKSTGEPSDGFRELLTELGLATSKRADECLTVWLEQLAKTYAWVHQHPTWPD
jgi:hypothetical protein